MKVCGDDPFAPWAGTTSHISEGHLLASDMTWAFVPGVPTTPIYDVNGEPQRVLSGQLNLTPPFSANLYLGDERYSLPLEEDKDCPDNTPYGAERMAP